MTDTITLRRAEAERGRTALRLARKFVGPTLSDELSIFLAALDAALEAQEDEALLNEPVAMRYDGDGYGYLYIDSGSGSDWQRRHKDAEPLYLAPPKPDAIARAVEAEREAICPIVYGLCISDNNAQEIVNAIRARGAQMSDAINPDCYTQGDKDCIDAINPNHYKQGDKEGIDALRAALWNGISARGSK
jgi:hypothetical protein